MDAKAKRRAIGQTIASERKRQGLTQRKLALMSGMNESYLCEVEKGTGNVSINKLIAIADALGVDVASLVKGV